MLMQRCRDGSTDPGERHRWQQIGKMICLAFRGVCGWHLGHQDSRLSTTWPGDYLEPRFAQMALAALPEFTYITGVYYSIFVIGMNQERAIGTVRSKEASPGTEDMIYREMMI